MNSGYPPLHAWSDHPRIGIDEFLQRFPRVAEEVEDEEEFRQYHAQRSIILITGDVSITQAQLNELKDDYGIAIAVDGNLAVEHSPLRLLYVSGALHCGSIDLGEWEHSPAGGPIVARHCATLWAEDHEVMRRAPAARVDTPFLFSWFYGIDNLDLSPETMIFILGDWDYCQDLDLLNPMFPWYECIYALEDEYVEHIYFDGADAPPWNHCAIVPALRAGKKLFKDGFDVACMEYQKAGDDYMVLKDYRAAYLAYKQSASIAPAYYRAWMGMADALYEADAYEQALRHYQEAAARFPAGQTRLVNQGLNYAALCAIRCRQLPLAIELASKSINHNQDLAAAEYYRDPCASAYRMRAEARYLSGDEAGAFQDLETALALNEYHRTANWLLGLLYYRRGDTKRAKQHHEAASARDEDFAVYYDQAGNTDFLAETPAHVDWDRPDIPPYTLPVKDEAYWRTFLRNSDPSKLKQVPQALRSTALCLEVLGRTPLPSGGNVDSFAEYFPAESFTRELAERLVLRSGGNLAYVPRALIDKPLCMLAPVEPGAFDATSVPPMLLDRELCLHAVRCGARIDELPPEWIDKALCVASIRRFVYSISRIPAEFLDDELYLEAIAHGEPYFFNNDLPGRYKTTAMLKKAISAHKRALDAIPGNRFDAQLYAHAQALYGQDADWPEIVARHDLAYCRQNPDEKCADICWSVFWDERFMLEKIRLEDYNLSPYEIPEHLFTQTIADACFAREPIHLDSIPKRFINQAMCDRFSKKYPDMLDHVPVTYRTRAICERAVKEDAQNLKLVPLALRSVDLCVTALCEDANLDAQVPLAIESQVFDRLLARHREDFYLGWLYNRRGDGYLAATPPAIDKALADYRTVIEADDSEEFGESRVQDAIYAIGYCHYLRGEFEQAGHWLNKLDTPDDWTPYAEFGFIDPKEVVDFEKNRFDDLMHELEGRE